VAFSPTDSIGTLTLDDHLLHHQKAGSVFLTAFRRFDSRRGHNCICAILSHFNLPPFHLLKSEVRLASRGRRAVTMRPRPGQRYWITTDFGHRYPRGRLTLGKKRPVRAA